MAWVSAEGVGVAPTIPTLGDRRACGHSIIGLAVFDRSALRAEASVRPWRAAAVVLFDWLMSTDLNRVPVEHPAQKQALADLLSRPEWDVDADIAGSTAEEIAAASEQVAKNMGMAASFLPAGSRQLICSARATMMPAGPRR